MFEKLLNALKGHKDITPLIKDMSLDQLTQVDEEGNTYLHLAVIFSALENVKLIYNACPELIKVQNTDGNTALHLAAQFSSVNIIKFVFKVENSPLLTENKELKVPIELIKGNNKKLKFVATVYIRKGYIQSLGNIFSKDENLEVLKNLCNKNLDLYSCLADDNLLNVVVENKQLETLKFLINYPSIRTSFFDILHHSKVASLPTEIISFICKKNPLVIDFEGFYQKTPLTRALQSGTKTEEDLNFLKLLLLYGAKIPSNTEDLINSFDNSNHQPFVKLICSLISLFKIDMLTKDEVATINSSIVQLNANTENQQTVQNSEDLTEKQAIYIRMFKKAIHLAEANWFKTNGIQKLKFIVGEKLNILNEESISDKEPVNKCVSLKFLAYKEVEKQYLPLEGETNFKIINLTESIKCDLLRGIPIPIKTMEELNSLAAEKLTINRALHTVGPTSIREVEVKDTLLGLNDLLDLSKKDLELIDNYIINNPSYLSGNDNLLGNNEGIDYSS